jgi:hypothetical protein
MITVSADVRLIPSPPAFVDRRKTGIGLFGALYSSINSCRNYHPRKSGSVGGMVEGRSTQLEDRIDWV